MKNLETIEKKDLIAFDAGGLVNAKLVMDYSTKCYGLGAKIRTVGMGDVRIMFVGTSGEHDAYMYVRMNSGFAIPGCPIKGYTYRFSAGLFQKHIKEILLANVDYWNNKEHYYGVDEVISFFNEVLEEGKEADPLLCPEWSQFLC